MENGMRHTGKSNYTPIVVVVIWVRNGSHRNVYILSADLERRRIARGYCSFICVAVIELKI